MHPEAVPEPAGFGFLTSTDGYGSYAGPVATIARWHWSDWPRLVRGQRVTAWDREWRVTDAWMDLSGNETYHLAPAGVVECQRGVTP